MVLALNATSITRAGEPGNTMKLVIRSALGFSLGVIFAIEAAWRRNQFVKALVLFYGTGGGKFNKTTATFMGHFAENDDWGAHTRKVNALEDRI